MAYAPGPDLIDANGATLVRNVPGCDGSSMFGCPADGSIRTGAALASPRFTLTENESPSAGVTGGRMIVFAFVPLPVATSATTLNDEWTVWYGEFAKLIRT